MLRRNLNDSARRPRIEPAPSGPGESRLTAAEAASLRALAEEAREPDAYDETLTSAEARLRIQALRARIHHERYRAGQSLDV